MALPTLFSVLTASGKARRPAARITLKISGGDGVTYESWPITQGIPFADGALERGTPVRVIDSDGNLYPTQASSLTTWNKDLQYVRWLLVDFQADYAQGDDRQFFLEYGPEAVPPQPALPIRIEPKDGCLSIDTGVMRLELRNNFDPWRQPNNADFFGRCLVKSEDGWRDLFRQKPGPFLYMMDQRGRTYDSYTSAPAPRVVVEEQGPLRASICVKGYHAMDNGPRFCPYILRLHLFAGKSDIRFHHTFVFDQEPHQIELAAIGTKLPLHLGEDLRAAVAGADAAHWASNWDTLSFLQTDDLHYQVQRNDAAFATGNKTSGWASLSGRLGSAAVVVKDLWQEYPKGFWLDSDGIDVQIWPEAYGDTLKFTTPFEEPAIRFDATRDETTFKRLLEENPTAPLNLKSLNIQTPDDMQWMQEMLEKYGKGRAASHNDTGTYNGVGAAKTTEFLLRLSASTIADAEAEALAQAVQEPLIAPADPAYACATRAFGHFYHAGLPRFREVDEGLDYMLESVAVEPRHVGRTYGMMRYGNMVCSHSAGAFAAYIYHKDKDPAKAFATLGPYNNEANDQITAVWGNFLRTGRRDHLSLAQAYSRCVADVAFIHAHPSKPQDVGLMHYHACHQWAGEPSPSHSLIGGLLLDYYASGNRRLLDVALGCADWVVRNQEDAGILSCHYVLHREFTGPLWILFDAYRATWREQYGDLAARSLEWFLNILPEPGRYPDTVYTEGERGDVPRFERGVATPRRARDVYELFFAALLLYDSEPLRKHIIAEADFFTWDYLTDNFVTIDMAKKLLTPRSKLWKVDGDFYWTQWGHAGYHFNVPIVAIAYELTGDLRYAALCKDHLEGPFLRQIKRGRKYAHWGFTWLDFGSYIPRMMWVVADAMNKNPEGLAAAEKEWKEERARRGLPVYTGPGVDLTKDTMDANGHILNRPPANIQWQETLP